jgi:hypothetical protein
MFSFGVAELQKVASVGVMIGGALFDHGLAGCARGGGDAQ